MMELASEVDDWCLGWLASDAVSQPF